MSLLKRISSIIIWCFVALTAGIAAIAACVFLYFSPNLPGVDSIGNIELQTPLRIYSSDGLLIGEFGDTRRDPVSFDGIPDTMIQAITAIEDDEFFEHSGVDVKGLLRAAYQLVKYGEIRSGGSTITMQLARGVFLSNEQTFSRKLREILLALKIEREISKNDIITLYLNQIFLGNSAYGIEAAAQVYYGKPIGELTLAQYAMIAGLPKAPSTSNPIASPSKALKRRNEVLARMRLLERISQEEYDQATNAPITAYYHGQKLDFNAPYVAELARVQAKAILDTNFYKDGYDVHTTINTQHQGAAQQALIDGLISYDQRHGYRGPERNLVQEGNNDRESWLETLEDTDTYGKLIPAVVTKVNQEFIDVLIKDGSSSTIAFNHGIKQARAYINENSMKAAPKSPAEVVKVGDIIRVIQKDDQWHLTQKPKIEAALVSLDSDTGSIISLVGGFDFKDNEYNNASTARRQPGSNFKPFVYALGLRSGMTPATVFNDAPVVMDDASLPDGWRPGNSDGKFYGPTRMRRALYLSRNLVSIRLLRQLGVENAVDELDRFGIDTTQVPRNLSMVLGTHIMTPQDVARGYAVFANGGYKVDPFLIKAITNRNGDVAYQNKPRVAPTAEPIPLISYNDESPRVKAISPELKAMTLSTRPAQQVLDSRTTFLMNSMLSDVVQRGTATRAKSLKRNDIAGKTGTTNGPTDAWFSGYQRHVVTSVWVGFSDNKKIGRREYGGTAALPIWIDYMKVALKDQPSAPFTPPEGVVKAQIDPTTGLRVKSGGVTEYFSSSNMPAFQKNSSADKTGTTLGDSIF